MTRPRKSKISIPLVSWRDGRPRYIPGVSARARGERGQDLRHADGRWYTVEEAMQWSEAKRNPAALGPAAPRLTVQGLSLAHILADFCDKNPRMLGKDIIEGRRSRRALSPKTITYYRDAAMLVERLDGGAWWVRLAATLDGPAIASLLHAVEVRHGLAQARAVRATLSVAFGWAMQNRTLAFNPVTAMPETLPVLPPRVRCGTIEEMHHLITAADIAGRPDVADIICLALWTGQRQKDRLSLTAAQMLPQEMHFRQSKKNGQPLLIPMAATLATRMAAKAQRRAALDQARAARRLPPLPQVMLDERAAKPFAQKHYQHVFRDVVLTAAHGLWRLPGGRLATVLPSGRTALKHVSVTSLRSIPQEAEQILPPCPSLLDFRDQDLRDTAVTWLARAGAQELEIAAITGHSLKTIKQILEHYFGLHPDLARRAISKLSGWHTTAEN